MLAKKVIIKSRFYCSLYTLIVSIRFCWHHRRHLFGNPTREEFASRVLRTGNLLTYLERAVEAAPQLFLQLCIIVRLGYYSEKRDLVDFGA